MLSCGYYVLKGRWPSIFFWFIVTLILMYTSIINCWLPLVAQMSKILPKMQQTWIRSLGQEDPLEKEMAAHSSILAWRIPWTEKPGGLQTMESQRVRHDWTSFTHSLLISIIIYIPVTLTSDSEEFKICICLCVIYNMHIFVKFHHLYYD